MPLRTPLSSASISALPLRVVTVRSAPLRLIGFLRFSVPSADSSERMRLRFGVPRIHSGEEEIRAPSEHAAAVEDNAAVAVMGGEAGVRLVAGSCRWRSVGIWPLPVAKRAGEVGVRIAGRRVGADAQRGALADDDVASGGKGAGAVEPQHAFFDASAA